MSESKGSDDASDWADAGTIGGAIGRVVVGIGAGLLVVGAWFAAAPVFTGAADGTSFGAAIGFPAVVVAVLVCPLLICTQILRSGAARLVATAAILISIASAGYLFCAGMTVGVLRSEIRPPDDLTTAVTGLVLVLWGLVVGVVGVVIIAGVTVGESAPRWLRVLSAPAAVAAVAIAALVLAGPSFGHTAKVTTDDLHDVADQRPAKVAAERAGSGDDERFSVTGVGMIARDGDTDIVMTNADDESTRWTASFPDGVEIDSWRVIEPPSDGAVVLIDTKREERDDVLVTAVDATSGDILWERSGVQFDLPDRFEEFQNEPLTGLIRTSADDSTVTSTSVRTGNDLWTYRLEPDCMIVAARARPAEVSVATSCAGCRPEVRALNPADGTVSSTRVPASDARIERVDVSRPGFVRDRSFVL